MGLTICNEYTSDIYVAIGYSNPNQCGSAGGWTKQGWWHIAPGQCTLVYGGSLQAVNRYWAYYAYATDGKQVWQGSAGNYCTQVTNQEFLGCWSDPSDYQICFAILDINSYDNFTLNLYG
jgi:uncharacterized membrane protein